MWRWGLIGPVLRGRGRGGRRGIVRSRLRGRAGRRMRGVGLGAGRLLFWWFGGGG